MKHDQRNNTTFNNTNFPDASQLAIYEFIPGVYTLDTVALYLQTWHFPWSLWIWNNTAPDIVIITCLGITLNCLTRTSQRQCKSWTTEVRCLGITGIGLDNAGMVQRWEHSPPTDVARVRLPDSVSYVGLICWFSTLHWEIPPPPPPVLRFPLSSKTNIWLDLLSLLISVYSVPY